MILCFQYFALGIDFLYDRSQARIDFDSHYLIHFAHLELGKSVWRNQNPLQIQICKT